MQAWLEHYLTARVFLTLAIAATLLLLLSLGLSWRSRMPWPKQAIALWGGLSIGLWAGLVSRNEWEKSAAISLAVAAVISVGVFALLLAVPAIWQRMMHKGMIARAQQAIGRTGRVYRTLDSQSDDGIVEVDGLGRFPAWCETHKSVAAFTAVQIIEADDQGKLRVTLAPPSERQ
jgi:hypothetical protein